MHAGFTTKLTLAHRLSQADTRAATMALTIPFSRALKSLEISFPALRRPGLARCTSLRPHHRMLATRLRYPRSSRFQSAPQVPRPRWGPTIPTFGPLVGVRKQAPAARTLDHRRASFRRHMTGSTTAAVATATGQVLIGRSPPVGRASIHGPRASNW